MNSYPKQILTLEQQLQSYKDAGMLIPSEETALNALTSIGYYRLRGYSYTLYDNGSKHSAASSEIVDLMGALG